jgi:hypothetical protein
MSYNTQRAEKLGRVDSIREYNLDYSGFPSALRAHMQVQALYTRYGAKEFTVISESGSRLIRERVFHKLLESEREAASDSSHREAVALTTANYRFSLLGCEPSDSRHCT